MDRKAAATIRINNASGPETANECTVQWRLKTLSKGAERLKDENAVAGHWKLMATN